MDVKQINLSKEYGLDGEATLKCILHQSYGEMEKYNQNLPAMIVVPGGGYSWCSEREGDPIAINFFQRHYNTFVLKYSCKPYVYPLSLTQLACAIDYVKSNAKELCVDPERVFIVGFSAGGHLCANLSVMCDNLPVDTANGKKIDARPAGAILSYPVIHPSSHAGSFQNLLGLSEEEIKAEPIDIAYENLLGKDEDFCEKAQALSLDKLVTPSTPPTFIWTTREDTTVNPTATIRYTSALHDNGVIYESHIFPYGWHGAATCDEWTNFDNGIEVFKKANIWIDLADEFCKSLKK